MRYRRNPAPKPARKKTMARKPKYEIIGPAITMILGGAEWKERKVVVLRAHAEGRIRNVAFYESTGTGSPGLVEAGEWTPFNGVSRHRGGWVIKAKGKKAAGELQGASQWLATQERAGRLPSQMLFEPADSGAEAKYVNFENINSYLLELDALTLREASGGQYDFGGAAQGSRKIFPHGTRHVREKAAPKPKNKAAPKPTRKKTMANEDVDFILWRKKGSQKVAPGYFRRDSAMSAGHAVIGVGDWKGNIVYDYHTVPLSEIAWLPSAEADGQNIAMLIAINSSPKERREMFDYHHKKVKRKPAKRKRDYAQMSESELIDLAHPDTDDAKAIAELEWREYVVERELIDQGFKLAGKPMTRPTSSKGRSRPKLKAKRKPAKKKTQKGLTKAEVFKMGSGELCSIGDKECRAELRRRGRDPDTGKKVRR